MSTQQQSKKLEEVIEQLVGAMKASKEMGCTEHLDCAPDGGEFWYSAIETAEALLGYNVPAASAAL